MESNKILTLKNRAGGQTVWIRKDEWDTLKKFERNHFRCKLNGWYNHPLWLERQKNKRKLKYAWILVGDTQKMVMMDPVTLVAYKLQLYEATWMIWKKYSFVRWCTPHDL